MSHDAKNERWRCSQCGLTNPPNKDKCMVCKAPRQVEQPPYAAMPVHDGYATSAAPQASAPSAPLIEEPGWNVVEAVAASAPPMASAPASAPPLDAASAPPSAPPEASSAPPAATAPQPEVSASPLVFDAAELAKCAWLTAEALRLEDHAAALDKAGKVAEALFHHRRATVKLGEAAEACPEQHPDKALLEEYTSDISLRMVYLEGLGGGQPTISLEDQVFKPELSMDLSAAAPPEGVVTDVAGLVAQTGASGSASSLDDNGYQMVAALKSDDEMKVFIQRILAAEGRTVQQGADATFGSFVADFSGTRQVQSFAQLQQALLSCPWNELILDPNKDKLSLAMDLEKEGHRFASVKLYERAGDMYTRSAGILGFVIKRDERMKNVKVKEMVEQRLQDVQAKAAEMTMKC